MFNKPTLLGAIIVTAGTLLFAADAVARVCLLRSSSGVCRFWSGSVSCEELNASGVGNVNKNPKSLECDINPPLEQPEIAGLVFCANNGGNVAPGVQASVAESFTGEAQIFKSQVDKNGIASGINVTANADLASLDTVCADELNRNWTAYDFVPCEMTVAVNLVDESDEVLAGESHSCSLPQCATLQWDFKADRPERREYDCDVQ